MSCRVRTSSSASGPLPFCAGPGHRRLEAQPGLDRDRHLVQGVGQLQLRWPAAAPGRGCSSSSSGHEVATRTDDDDHEQDRRAAGWPRHEARRARRRTRASTSLAASTRASGQAAGRPAGASSRSSRRDGAARASAREPSRGSTVPARRPGRPSAAAGVAGRGPGCRAAARGGGPGARAAPSRAAAAARPAATTAGEHGDRMSALIRTQIAHDLRSHSPPTTSRIAGGDEHRPAERRWVNCADVAGLTSRERRRSRTAGPSARTPRACPPRRAP